MIEHPLADNAMRLPRESAGDDFAVGQADEGFETLIAGVEVRWRVIIMIHPDDDAEEDRDDGHRPRVAAFCAARKHADPPQAPWLSPGQTA